MTKDELGYKILSQADGLRLIAEQCFIDEALGEDCQLYQRLWEQIAESMSAWQKQAFQAQPETHSER